MSAHTKKFNKEYFNLWKEIPLFFLVRAKALISFKKVSNNKILIVAPCLIGEFVAIIPALRDFIQRNESYQVDLLVTPQLKGLAQRIRGVRQVFGAASVYGRKEESPHQEIEEEYRTVLILRISPDAFSVLRAVTVQTVQTYALRILGYGIVLGWNLMIGRTPKRWRTFNFEILGGKDRNLSFEEIFEYTEQDERHVSGMLPQGGGERVLLHTTANWTNKNWSNEKWVILLEKIHTQGNFHFIFVGSSEDQEAYDYISSHVPFTVHSLIYKTELKDLPLLFWKSDYFIGIDSGPSNTAHLVGLPNVTMVGVSPNMYLSPHKTDVTIDKTGNRGIMYMFFNHMDNPMKRISVDDVYHAFMSLKKERVI